MSAENVNVSPIINTATDAVKQKKPTLAGKFSKLLNFGFWIASMSESEELKSQLYTQLRLFGSVEEQTELFERFFVEEKDITKLIRKRIAEHNKPPKPVKEPKTKAPRKGKALVHQDQLINQLIADANAEFVTEPKLDKAADKAEKEAAKLAKEETARLAKEAAKLAKEETARLAKEAAKLAKEETARLAKEAKEAEKEAAKLAKEETVRLANEAKEEAIRLAKQAKEEAIRLAKQAKELAKPKAEKKTKATKVAAPAQVVEELVEEVVAAPAPVEPVVEVVAAPAQFVEELVEEVVAAPAPVEPVVEVVEAAPAQFVGELVEEVVEAAPAPVVKDATTKKAAKAKEPKAAKAKEPKTTKATKKAAAEPVKPVEEEEEIQTRIATIAEKEYLIDQDFNVYNFEEPHDHIGTYNQETGAIDALWKLHIIYPVFVYNISKL